MTYLKNCNFGRWAQNHSPEHKDRIYRELYPFRIFEQIDFSEELLHVEQIIEFNQIKYFIELKKNELQENIRFRTTFSLTTTPKSKRKSWENRSWNEQFQIVYSSQNDFITVFTKKEFNS